MLSLHDYLAYDVILPVGDMMDWSDRMVSPSGRLNIATSGRPSL